MVAAPLLGSVLVTGGCGFLGYEVVRQLVEDPECGSIAVLDRNTSRNRHDKVRYVEDSIADAAVVARLLAELQPTVIFHLASPNFTFPVKGRHDFYETNVKGTEILLKAATDSESVKAFVHCSSVDIYASPPHRNVSESHALCLEPYHEPYASSKAIADQLVLAASGTRLKTTSIRLAHMYGSRCTQQMQKLLDVCAGNGALARLGDGKNMCEVISCENSAAVHILAAKALLDPSRANGRVDGEAFNASDNKPVPFWYHTRLFWSVARGKEVRDEDLWVIPAGLARLIYALVSWLFWIFTLGRVSPPAALGETALGYSLEDRTYDGSKAVKRLGFQPHSDHDAVIREAVREELLRRRQL